MPSISSPQQTAATSSPNEECGRVLEVTYAALAAYAEQPDYPPVVTQLRRALRAASEEIAAYTTADLAGDGGSLARELVTAVSACGVHDAPVAQEELQRAQALAVRAPAGLLGAMLLSPAWQWPGAPKLAHVPTALVADYAAWLIAVPQGFVARGQADLFAQHYLQRLEDILAYARNPATPELGRAVLATYLKRGNCIPLYFCSDSLRRHYELRAQLLQCAVARPAIALAPRSRVGRRLRVGFINRHFGPQTETYTTLPMFEQLDPSRFEVLLFAQQLGGSLLEEYARHHAASLTLLPSEIGAQIDQLRAASLDIAVFGTNVTAVFNEVVRVALHRVAPLQLVNNSSCTTTGLPEVDLYVSGTLTEAPDAPEHFTERLGLVAGPAHAFNYEADRQEPTGTWTRAALGLPEDAIVFVTAANYFKIIPEMQDVWARLLAAVPGSRLLLHPFNPNWSSSYPIKRFTAELDRTLAAHGVATDRVVVSSVKFPSRSDVKALLAVGDVYLDTFPFGGVNSLVDPLELGLPVIVWEGGTFRARMGGALLRSLGLDDFIATDEAGYLVLATRLALDPAARESARARVAEAMGRAPVFLDPLAASDALGALLETAFDEVAAVGRAEFRRRRSPVVVPPVADPMGRINEGVIRFEAGDFQAAGEVARSVLGVYPAHPAARHLLGAVLLNSGEATRAVDYFLGAVQHAGDNAPLWHDLAVALCECGRHEPALQALETSLRLAPERLDGWLLFAELALAAGNHDLFGHALGVVEQISPGDPRIAELRARAGGAEAKHVLLYTDDPDRGGVAHYNHSLLIALARAGYRVSCVQTVSDGPLVAEQRAAGVSHHWLDYDSGRDFVRTVTDELTPRRLFERERPDLIVFSDCCPMSNLAAREMARQLGIPYVVVVGFVGAYLAENFVAQLPMLARQYAGAREVVAVSAENLGLLRTRFGLGANQGQVIHYGRPDKFFTPRDEVVRARLRAELHLPADAVVCLTTARLTGVKGFVHQLNAIKRLRTMPAGARLYFVWAGDGDQRAALEQEIQRHGLGRQVHLIGHRSDVAQWYDAADIFVLPSHMEGMPLAIMEAMAKGLPVVATAVSGIPEELGDTGRLLPDPAAQPERVAADLAATLALWAVNPALRAEVGRRGCQRAREMFREALMIERTLAVVSAHVSAPASAASAS